MKIIFMGTPDFAVYSMDAIQERGDEIALVISQEDRPRDRGKKIQPTPVKQRAQELEIEVYQPLSIKIEEAFEKIDRIKPDLIVVTAYGQIIPKRILEVPKYGCINVHASLLPRHRGAAPIHFALINGDEKTGITTMYISEALDTGDMILKDELDILEEDDLKSLHDKLAILSKKTLKETLDRIENGSAERHRQCEECATYAPLIKKEMGHIDFSKTPEEIKNISRALSAYAKLNGNTIKLWQAEVGEEVEGRAFGEIYRVNKDNIEVVAKGKTIKFYEIQIPNKKRMRVEDFLKGNEIETGAFFE
ncbi:MAG: methionyl-tRNA formyltransferase [Peptostreptococcaceae bacterium]|nr:methionyl-tRNA formyltransferase [Peptostreptococcaceae bacterium]